MKSTTPAGEDRCCRRRRWPPPAAGSRQPAASSRQPAAKKLAVWQFGSRRPHLSRVCPVGVGCHEALAGRLVDPVQHHPAQQRLQRWGGASEMTTKLLPRPPPPPPPPPVPPPPLQWRRPPLVVALLVLLPVGVTLVPLVLAKLQAVESAGCTSCESRLAEATDLAVKGEGCWESESHQSMVDHWYGANTEPRCACTLCEDICLALTDNPALHERRIQGLCAAGATRCTAPAAANHHQQSMSERLLSIL